ncbi:hypothetical protein FQN53_009620 [Emmonsiellopsis sp. PD_33]|nr:hypothetical protein FQN53_009620 [Emmonsiellopsis sp. PD_33]
MPVTTRAASVEVKPFTEKLESPSPSQILRKSCPDQYNESGGLINTSLGKCKQMRCSRNGFVNCALDAYLQHNHLIIRPEDVWLAILTQFNFYVNAHAEELRDLFVSHEGTKKLEIVQEGEMDIKAFALEMPGLIAENIKDPALKEWIMPSFTTTTTTDKVVASIVMMGTMQKYFGFCLSITCGIPSVTLLGERRDWEDILQRLEFLNTFKEHEQLLLWSSMLKPILSQFVRTFDAPDSPEIVKFWQKTVHQHVDDYSGEKHITGWILAFCFWDTKGGPLVAVQVQWQNPGWQEKVEQNGPDFWLDEDKYGELEWENVPTGFAHVPVNIRFLGGTEYVALLIAGSVGWRLLDSDTIFPKTRGEQKKMKVQYISPASPVAEQDPSHNSLSDETGAIWGVLRKLVCLEPKQDDPVGEKIAPSVAGSSSSTESEEEWEYENGGKRDAIQPVSGWWAVKKKSLWSR